MTHPPQSPQSATIIPAHTVRHAATTLVVAVAAVAEDGNQNRQNSALNGELKTVCPNEAGEVRRKAWQGFFSHQTTGAGAAGRRFVPVNVKLEFGHNNTR